MRTRILSGIIFISFLFIIAGLFHLQIIRREAYKRLSDKNRIRILPLEAPRGKIYDAKKKLLVTNRLSFDVEVVYQEVKDVEGVTRLLHDMLGADRGMLSKRIAAAKTRPYAPAKIVEDIGKEKAIELEEIKLDFPGVIITTTPIRDYLYGSDIPHVIGYLGRISESELIKYRAYGCRVRDFVGKDGIEKKYNDYLRGVDGGLQIEVDSKGRQLGLLAVKEPRAGKDLYITIDIELQRFCNSLLVDRKGAVVVMDPFTGAILALVSHPNFDSNAFIRPDNFKRISELFSDSEGSPMLNRVIGGTYPPGSIFKIVIAAAALELNKITENTKLPCDGSYTVGDRVFHCWLEGGHGTQILIYAIKNSCNVFFYQLGLRVGVDGISRYATMFGFGRCTRIDLPGETSGLVPTRAWKRRARKEPWFKGETANYSIGQGYLLVTPLQSVSMMSVIANGGKLVQPHIVRKIEDVVLSYPEAKDIGLKPETIEIIKEGLGKVVNEQGGTGRYARVKGVVMAGKTGTAQNPRGIPHGWFAGFAPLDDPRISFIVFTEHGGKGGYGASRLAKKLVEEAKRLELL